MRLSLRKARNSESQPTLKLFKSFAQALRQSDPTLSILPVNASKQNLPMLSTASKITATDANKLHTYFKSYYPNQKSNLSGYINIITNLSFEELDIAPPIYEWLETNRYTMRECPSHEEEMIQLGVFCFGSEYIYREDLKRALQEDPRWQFPTLETAPIIQLTRGEFRSQKKSKKMIFIHTEKSKQHEVAKTLSKMYDGTSKAYPNGIMLLFIPLHDNIQYDAAYRQKVVYNHEQYLGTEEGISIYGLQDLDMVTTLKNNQNITIRMLLKSLPATQGMQRPQLFQLAETNSSRETITVTYQKEDKELVYARLHSLQNDIVAQLAPGEANRIFISETEGITFRPIVRTKGGQIIPSKPTSQHTMEHVQHTKSILSSPPKKRPYTPRSSEHNQANIHQPQQNPPTNHQIVFPTAKYASTVQQTALSNNQQNQHTNHIAPPPAINPQPTISTFSEEINNRFNQVEEELRNQQLWNEEQREWNEDVILRMNYIEDTTTSTDNKVDAIISKLDSWDIPTKRRGIATHNTEERSAPYPHLPDFSGDMKK